ncbi:hypothetical protein IRP63_16240 [Clostridium phage CWou-2020a]|uniref:Phage protein, HK97 gp10 family n=1 Tax=Clostridium botulinum C/D str. DC5 TaxID=1443128 RepID=A0A0A0IKS5_CLOBO|nr:HK97-gp10 family putative phage morphogenesis protein [Clostridium botulinum]QPW59419.1 hypothetical protein IRP63_16240 [Clostridium phage CWou-2020a]KGN00827.1 hypothetical protein Z955_02390 [Clostridium botulinum C/D str. DC5]KOC54191.1 hypothetical protein ADU90_12695 [Clostridium botulinum]KOC56535.1 hypothetical protein ADU89_02705 [Clostridium botulinum]MCD3240918.1 hypothetical protein [Clostridium botulinum D/C]
MSNGIEIEGLEEFEEMIKGMTITDSDAKGAVRESIKPIAKAVENNTPEGHTKRLKKVSKTVKVEGLGITGIVRAKTFYDVFQEFGTSQQKHHIGYFEKAVKESVDEALKILTKKLLEDKIK